MLTANQAYAVFPLRPQLRDAWVAAHLFVSLHPDIVAEVVQEALANDPYSPSLLAYRTEQHLKRGNMEEALKSFKVLQHVMPDAPLTQAITARYIIVARNLNSAAPMWR